MPLVECVVQPNVRALLYRLPVALPSCCSAITAVPSTNKAVKLCPDFVMHFSCAHAYLCTTCVRSHHQQHHVIVRADLRLAQPIPAPQPRSQQP